jgi:hypothetical protein
MARLYKPDPKNLPNKIKIVKKKKFNRYIIYALFASYVIYKENIINYILKFLQ